MTHNINGVEWRLQEATSNNITLWLADYYCKTDNDQVELYIKNDHNAHNNSMQLSCFSGNGISNINIDSIDFPRFREVAQLETNEPIIVSFLKIADYFCRIFCDYIPKKECMTNGWISVADALPETFKEDGKVYTQEEYEQYANTIYAVKTNKGVFVGKLHYYDGWHWQVITPHELYADLEVTHWQYMPIA